MSFNIIGTGFKVPEKIVTNDDLSKIVDTSDEWITTRTGISQRRIATTETALSLSVDASKQALERSKISASDIDLVICSIMRSDTYTPSLACSVSEALGITAPAFDINAACTGVLYAQNIAKMYFDAGQAKNILIISCEILSRLIDWSDRATCVLFGDGAAASVLTKGTGLLASHISAVPDSKMMVGYGYDGKSPFSEVSNPDYFLHMNGQDVYKFAVNTMVKEVKTVLEMANLTSDDITYFMPHQANERIIDAACKKLSIGGDRVVKNIDKYGNMSSVSVLSLLAETDSACKLKAGDKILMVAFGAGMTAGASIIEWK